MTAPVKNNFFDKLWSLGCSLKLAIALASAATLLIMTGSLIMHFNPELFGNIEQDIMANWLPNAWRRNTSLLVWLPLSGVCVLFFALNTLCCFIDWIVRFKARWRKSGEYLIHFGFLCLTFAFIWANTMGFRSGPHRIFPGESISIPKSPGYSLRLEEFNVQMEPNGRPLDMISNVSLWKDDQQVKNQTIRINHPLIFDGFIILPTSFGQEVRGFRFHIPGKGLVPLTKGERLPLDNGLSLLVNNFFPDARKNNLGQVAQTGSRLNNPALQLSLYGPSEKIWQGWYFLREPLPKALTNEGVFLRPVEPVINYFSLLTINRDPGDKLALSGGLCITVGVVFAFFSFYRKRALGDRPEI